MDINWIPREWQWVQGIFTIKMVTMMIIVVMLEWSLFAWYEARKVSNLKEKIINRCHPFFIPDTKHVFCHLMLRWLSVKFWYKYLCWWTISLMQAHLEIEDSWRTFWVKSFWKITSRILYSCLFFLSFSVVGCHSDGSQQDTKNICWKMLFVKECLWHNSFFATKNSLTAVKDLEIDNFNWQSLLSEDPYSSCLTISSKC